MLTFYLIRHGQTDGNVRGIRPGDLPFTLTELGQQQAAKTAEALKTVKFDIVYTSDYLRTVQTAGFIMRHQKCDLKFDPRLRDIQQGGYLGLNPAEIAERFPGPPIGTQWEHYSVRRPGGESFADCEARAWDFMLEKADIWSMPPVRSACSNAGGVAGFVDDSDSETCGGSGSASRPSVNEHDVNIGVVTHGGLVNVIAKMVTSVWNPKIAGNCSITVVRFNDGEWTLDRMDDTSHLA